MVGEDCPEREKATRLTSEPQTGVLFPLKLLGTAVSRELVWSYCGQSSG